MSQPLWSQPSIRTKPSREKKSMSIFRNGGPIPSLCRTAGTFKNKNTKSWFRNNLEKLLQKRLEIRLSGEKICDNSWENILEVYRDLWLHKKQRDDMVEDGIASDAMRKKVSKDDVTNDDADATALFGIFGTKQRIKIGKILKDHGLYAPYNMANNLQYVVTLPKAEEIMNAQANEKVEGYSLENIELEYNNNNNNNFI
ncbi:Hypothetical predicted protein [Paramuricea clavata]|uniref:Uncharacterized protein n=1 Tax=Paramuricea clavata TaxID=317549 RepID=A0A6S7J864_PARCT|nr:Hypothetical predicted protein [Paramuricea clavata]